MDQSPTPELQTLREQINALDTELLRILGERQSVVEQVSAYKQAHNLPIFDPEREQAMLARIRELAAAQGLDEDMCVAIMQSILEASKRRQVTLRS